MIAKIDLKLENFSVYFYIYKLELQLSVNLALLK
jgi:hypothetical protein